MRASQSDVISFRLFKENLRERVFLSGLTSYARWSVSSKTHGADRPVRQHKKKINCGQRPGGGALRAATAHTLFCTNTFSTLRIPGPVFFRFRLTFRRQKRPMGVNYFEICEIIYSNVASASSCLLIIKHPVQVCSKSRRHLDIP